MPFWGWIGGEGHTCKTEETFGALGDRLPLSFTKICAPKAQVPWSLILGSRGDSAALFPTESPLGWGPIFQMAGVPDQGQAAYHEEEDSTVSGPTDASEVYKKQEEYGSAPTLLLEHAEMLCHLKRHHSISKQLKILLN